MLKIRFLTIQEILNIHEKIIELYGGCSGIRDQGLLESALFQPQASFSGNYVHKNILMMSAAYVFHLIKNHPFVDGNKRTGIVVMALFLEYNGFLLNMENEALYDLGVNIASSKLIKIQIAKILKQHAKFVKK